MDENKEKPQITELRRELQRRSLDQIKVYNPLSTPFFTIFDGFTHVCQARGEAIFPRYVAEKWMKEFANYMITKDEEEYVRSENEKRVKRGQPILDPQERETVAYREKLLTNDPERRLSYMKMVYKGVTKEYGMDIPDDRTQKLDKRPLDEKIFEQLEQEAGLPQELDETPAQDIERKKDKLAKELSDEA